jgi:hypothetical protein
MSDAHVAMLKSMATITFTAAEMNISPDQAKPKMTAISGTTALATGGR